MRLFKLSIFRVLLISCLFSVSAFSGFAQEQYKENKKVTAVEEFKGGSFYPVQKYEQITTKKHPKNIILFIGDGMGLAHIYASMTANGGSLFLQNFIHCGFSKTYSSSDYITDSAAGGTALACGVKTYDGAIGVDPDKKPVPNIREMAEKKGLKTGLVSTSAINLLSQSKKGFFLMVEGSEIDFVAHNNHTPGVIRETLDMDRAIGAALAFAAKNRETLIIVTADHETGGMTITEGNNKTGDVTAKYTSLEHTGVCVPVFAFGPGAEQFGGFMENTDIAKKMMALLRVK